MADPTDLDELDRLEKAATPGEWDEIGDRQCVIVTSSVLPTHVAWCSSAGLDPTPRDRANAAFIAAARNALPGLIAELREARRMHAIMEGFVAQAMAMLERAEPYMLNYIAEHTKKETTDAE